MGLFLPQSFLHGIVNFKFNIWLHLCQRKGSRRSKEVKLIEKIYVGSSTKKSVERKRRI